MEKEETAPQPMRKQFWSSDKILSISAMLISIGTLMVLVYQTELIRKQQFASALPNLEIWRSRGKDYYRLIITNTGVGPAFVERVVTRVKGKDYEMDVPEFYYDHLDLVGDTLEFISSNIVPGRVIQPGKEINMIEVQQSPEDASGWLDFMDRDSVELRITYRSIYGETWTCSNLNLIPRKED